MRTRIKIDQGHKVEVKEHYFLRDSSNSLEYMVSKDNKLYRPANIFALINPQHSRASYRLISEDSGEISDLLSKARLVRRYD